MTVAPKCGTVNCVATTTGPKATTETYRTNIQDHGRVVIPAPLRRDLQFNIGDEVFLRVEQSRIVITRADDAVGQFQASVARHFPQDRNLVDELIAERRAEAARDE